MRWWQRAREGEGQVVLLSGEPGIGKSRIIQAVQDGLGAEPHTRLRYFCSPHHQDSALGSHSASLQASLLARLDRLAPVRDMAQIAAALGRQFSHELISAVAEVPEQKLEDALDRLVGAELTFRRGIPPTPSTLLSTHWCRMLHTAPCSGVSDGRSMEGLPPSLKKNFRRSSLLNLPSWLTISPKLG